MTETTMTTDRIASADDLSFYLSETLGFCGCGDPEGAIALLHKTLQIMRDRSAVEGGYAVRKPYYDAMEKVLSKEHAPGLYWWFLYFLGHNNLTEHGGSCCGAWLTLSGEQLLAALDKWGSVIE